MSARNRRPQLSRRYGYFRCVSCQSTWESSYVFCVAGTDRVYYKQECRGCKTACNPYRVERLICSVCGSRDCKCTEKDKKKRNTDLNKPHRSDLCQKCKAGWPCIDNA